MIRQKQSSKLSLIDNFYDDLRILKIPHCVKDCNHNQEALSQICIKKDCNNYLEPICNDCIFENTHGHGMTNFVNYKSFIKDIYKQYKEKIDRTESRTEKLYDFNNNDAANFKNLDSNQNQNSNQNEDQEKCNNNEQEDIDILDNLAKQCKILADQFLLLSEKILEFKEECNFQEKYYSKDFISILESLVNQNQISEGKMKQDLNLLKDYIKINENNPSQDNLDIQLLMHNNKQIQVLQQKKFAQMNLKTKIKYLNNKFNQFFTNQNNEISIDKYLQTQEIQFKKSTCNDSYKIVVDEDQKIFQFGKNTRQCLVQQIYSPILSQGKNVMQFKINKVYPSSGTYFWVALLEDGNENKWFSGKSICYQQVLSQTCVNIQQSKGDMSLSQIFNNDGSVDFQIIIDFDQNTYILQNLKYEIEFISQNINIQGKNIRLIFGINDQLSIDLQVIGYSNFD